jgi:hypothetical protein
MKKRFEFELWHFLALFICLMGAVMYPVWQPFTEPYPQVGQQWTRTFGDEDDPFDAPRRDTVTVIATQDGYVQYRRRSGNTDSRGHYMFRFSSKLLSPSKP